MLEKIVSVDLIEVVENGAIQVRTKTAVIEDGKQLSGTFHRHVVAPGTITAPRMPRFKPFAPLYIRQK